MWLEGSSLSHWDLSFWLIRLRNCGVRVPWHVGFLVPQPGIKPVSPALQGQFLSTGPPGKSQAHPFSLSLCRLGKESVESSQLKGIRKIGATFFFSSSSSLCIFFSNVLSHLNKKNEKGEKRAL